MNWQRAAIDDLRKYENQKASLDHIVQRIGALKSGYEALKCVTTDKTPVMGGGSRIEDAMLNNIVERQRLEYTYRATRRLVGLVERGLAGLDERERLVLERFFIHRSAGHLERLMGELGYEQRQVYRIKDEALYKFTICMYGMIDY